MTPSNRKRNRLKQGMEGETYHRMCSGGRHGQFLHPARGKGKNQGLFGGRRIKKLKQKTRVECGQAGRIPASSKIGEGKGESREGKEVQFRRMSRAKPNKEAKVRVTLQRQQKPNSEQGLR